MDESRKRMKMGMGILLFAVILGILPAMIVAIHPAGIEAQTTEVSIQNATASVNETVEVPINIMNVTD